MWNYCLPDDLAGPGWPYIVQDDLPRGSKQQGLPWEYSIFYVPTWPSSQKEWVYSEVRILDTPVPISPLPASASDLAPVMASVMQMSPEVLVKAAATAREDPYMALVLLPSCIAASDGNKLDRMIYLPRGNDFLVASLPGKEVSRCWIPFRTCEWERVRNSFFLLLLCKVCIYFCDTCKRLSLHTGICTHAFAYIYVKQ